MQKLKEPASPRTPVVAEASKPWHAEVGELLAQAAILCVEQGVDVESFMKGAWSAYLEARPGMRDYLEEMQLLTQLEELRKADKIGKA